MTSIFEKNIRKFLPAGAYFLPDLKVQNEADAPIGIYGERHKRYLKQYHRIRYYNLLTSGKLNSYLADVNGQAEEMFASLVKQPAENEGITEQLKASDPMEWVRRINNIRSRANEIVNSEVVFV